ncbi:MazG-like family protein [Clostridium sp. DL1XJH146]
MKKEDFNIISNIRLVEHIKSQILYVVADLFNLLSKGSHIAKDSLATCIAGAIILFYILGEKLGYSYIKIDEEIKKSLQLGIDEEDELEANGKSLSNLQKYFIKRN